MQHTLLCAKASSDVIPSVQNSSKIVQSTYAMNPDVYTVISQDFVDSIATNLYVGWNLRVFVNRQFHATYIIVCQKASSKCNTYCAEFLQNCTEYVCNESRCIKSQFTRSVHAIWTLLVANCSNKPVCQDSSHTVE